VRLSCGAILLCDLRPSAARRAYFPPDCVSWRGPSSRRSQRLFEMQTSHSLFPGEPVLIHTTPLSDNSIAGAFTSAQTPKSLKTLPSTFRRSLLCIRSINRRKLACIQKMVLRATRRGAPPRDEVRRGNKRDEQPTASDRKAKSHHREPAPIGIPRRRRIELLSFCNFSVFWNAYRWGVGEQDSVRTPDEDAVWRSEVRLKRPAGTH